MSLDQRKKQAGVYFSSFVVFALKYFEISVFSSNSCKVGLNTVEINQGFTKYICK